MRPSRSGLTRTNPSARPAHWTSTESAPACLSFIPRPARRDPRERSDQKQRGGWLGGRSENLVENERHPYEAFSRYVERCVSPLLAIQLEDRRTDGSCVPALDPDEWVREQFESIDRVVLALDNCIEVELSDSDALELDPSDEVDRIDRGRRALRNEVQVSPVPRSGVAPAGDRLDLVGRFEAWWIVVLRLRRDVLREGERFRGRARGDRIEREGQTSRVDVSGRLKATP